MGILRWDNPARAIPKEEWLKISADCAPPGVYTSNMSEEDAATWRAKVTGQRRGQLQVEIRKWLCNAQLVIIVGLHGYNYKHYRVEKDPEHPWMGITTEGKNVHMALNAGAMMTLDEFREIGQAVEEAVDVLKRLESS